MSCYRERAVTNWSEESVRLIITPSLTAKSMFYYVQEIGSFKCLPGYCTEREKLPSYLIVYTLGGLGRLTYRGNNYIVGPRQAFFIDCMEYQYYETDADDLWEMLWVHIDGGACRSYYERYAADGGPVCELPADSTVSDCIMRLLKLHAVFDIRTEPLSSLAITELLTQLLMNRTTGGILKSRESFLPEYIAAATHYMDKHYGEPVTLERLARECAMSKYHLAREFKRCTGLSPIEYLTNIRITRAKEILKYGDDPIHEIAARIGYDNVSHFIALFRRHVGQTPLVYRRTWQQPK